MQKNLSQTALRANPKDPLIQMALSKVYIRLRKYDQAVDLLKTYTKRESAR